MPIGAFMITALVAVESTVIRFGLLRVLQERVKAPKTVTVDEVQQSLRALRADFASTSATSRELDLLDSFERGIGFLIQASMASDSFAARSYALLANKSFMAIASNSTVSPMRSIANTPLPKLKAIAHIGMATANALCGEEAIFLRHMDEARKLDSTIFNNVVGKDLNEQILHLTGQNVDLVPVPSATHRRNLFAARLDELSKSSP